MEWDSTFNVALQSRAVPLRGCSMGSRGLAPKRLRSRGGFEAESGSGPEGGESTEASHGAGLNFARCTVGQWGAEEVSPGI